MSFTLIKPSTCFVPKISSSSNPQRLRAFTLRCSSRIAASGLAERPWKVSDARLVLEDGSVWKAKSFGASGTQLGEVVFNTSLTGHSRTRKGRFGNCPFWSFPVSMARASEHSPGLVGEETLTQVKSDLYQALEGINRGIFGVPSAKKSEIEGLVKQLESLNPTSDPTLNLEKVVGSWKLVYSTITILGSKRTKLGLRDFISLGDFFQTIDVAKSKAVNVIKFNVRGFKMLDGKLTIEASFKISSTSRVDISYDSSSITPEQLMNVFRKNYDLLLGIFNPEGWLEITFVDDTMRIGRDDKGNIFILERSEDD